MKIIHCADIHLDSPFRRLDDPDKKRERKNELVAAWNSMISDAQASGASVVIIAGDLFDQSKVSAFSKKAVIESIKNHPSINFYYLKGNHDQSDVFASLSNSDMPANLFLFGEKWTTYDLGENITLSGAELTASNAYSIFSELTLPIDKFNIVTLHGQETDTSANGNPDCVSLRDLRGRNIDYLALGHIHSFKLEQLDKRGAYCYPGCLEARGFDETGDHGYMLLDIDGASGKISYEKHSKPIRNAYEVEVDISGLMNTSEIITKIENDLAGTQRSALANGAQASGAQSGTQASGAQIHGSDMVKVILTGEVDAECEKNLEYIGTAFSSAFYDFKIKDHSKTKIDFNAYKLDKSLKGEFVRAVEESDTLSDEDKNEIIKIGILALKGEEVM